MTERREMDADQYPPPKITVRPRGTETHCPNGHLRSENMATYGPTSKYPGKAYCRVCVREAVRRSRARKRAAKPVPGYRLPFPTFQQETGD